jgi:hypothetical protein
MTPNLKCEIVRGMTRNLKCEIVRGMTPNLKCEIVRGNYEEEMWQPGQRLEKYGNLDMTEIVAL